MLTKKLGALASAVLAVGLLAACTQPAKIRPVVQLSADLDVLEARPGQEVTLSWEVTGDYTTLTLTTVPTTTSQVVTGTSTVVVVPTGLPAIEYVLTATGSGEDLSGSDSTGQIVVPLWVCENPSDVITFADAALEQRFRALATVPNEGDLTCAHALSVTAWDTGDWDGAPGEVESLVGIQHLVNLATFVAHWNNISDLTPIAALSNLQRLNLDKNRITDLSPLTNHPSLRILEVWDNGPVRDQGTDGIADLSPLATIPTLEQLFLSENNISDLSPLAGLTSLTLIYAIGNQITDIAPLANLTDLQVLRLSANMIADGSVLAGLENLGWVELEYNLMTDEVLEPFEGFENLWVVKLEGNYFTDFTPFISNPDFPASSGVPGLPAHRGQPSHPWITVAYNCVDDYPPVVAALQAKSAELVIDDPDGTIVRRPVEDCDDYLDGAGFGSIDLLLRQQEVMQMYREQDRIR